MAGPIIATQVCYLISGRLFLSEEGSEEIASEKGRMSPDKVKDEEQLVSL